MWLGRRHEPGVGRRSLDPLPQRFSGEYTRAMGDVRWSRIFETVGR